MSKNLRFRGGSPRSVRGMSLVEIMVAAVIGLIGIVVISQVFAVSESMKRTTTGGSDAQVSGNIALFTIERDLRFSGFGLVTNNSNMLGCTTLAHNGARTGGGTDFNFVMAPVLITGPNGGAISASQPDEIRVVYSNAANMVEGAAFAGPAATGTDFPLKNSAGFQVGDLIVAWETAKSCSLAQITGFVPASVNTIIHASATSTYNKAGGLAVDYTANAMLFNMGSNPVVKTYKISSDRLKFDGLMPYTPGLDTDSDGQIDVIIADGIVNMKALYGKDTNGDLIVDAWNTTAPTTAAQWLQVRAVRIALLARSGQYEKNPVYTPAGCTGAGCTPAAPIWISGDGATAASFTMANPADGTDWRNYRYVVYQTTVPLRNMIWSNDP